MTVTWQFCHLPTKALDPGGERSRRTALGREIVAEPSPLLGKIQGAGPLRPNIVGYPCLIGSAARLKSLRSI